MYKYCRCVKNTYSNLNATRHETATETVHSCKPKEKVAENHQTTDPFKRNMRSASSSIEAAGSLPRSSQVDPPKKGHPIDMKANDLSKLKGSQINVISGSTSSNSNSVHINSEIGDHKIYCKKNTEVNSGDALLKAWHKGLKVKLL